MAFILNIDTATTTASVGFADENGIIAMQTSRDQMNHAAFVQTAISKLVESHKLCLQDIDAVAVVNGPGSYTGLRVGLSSAKGLCYALGKPLILLNTLEVMALASIEVFPEESILHCPMLDARRMEVFTAIYDSQLLAVLPPQPMILTASSFDTFLEYKKVVFSGSGQIKLESVINHQNAIFSQIAHSLQQVNILAQQAFNDKRFNDLAYCEPFYLKNFYTF